MNRKLQKRARATRKKQVNTASCAPRRACVFLDRDGVINQGGLVNKPSEIKLIEGAAAAIASLKRAGYLVGVATNQGGLFEDLNGNVMSRKPPLTRQALGRIHAEMLRQLGPDARPDFIKICPHAKSVRCTCRKPKGGMLVSAAGEHNIDLSRSYMVGDMSTDIQAGLDAGVTPLFVLSGFDPSEKDKCPADTLVFNSLREAAAHVLSQLPS